MPAALNIVTSSLYMCMNMPFFKFYCHKLHGLG